MKERTKLLWIVGIFSAAYYVPWSHPLIRQSGLEAFMMLQEYAREHVLTCLIPAFFIAGAIAVFVSQGAVLKYFGAQASRFCHTRLHRFRELSWRSVPALCCLCSPVSIPAGPGSGRLQHFYTQALPSTYLQSR